MDESPHGRDRLVPYTGGWSPVTPSTRWEDDLDDDRYSAHHPHRPRPPHQPHHPYHPPLPPPPHVRPPKPWQPTGEIAKSLMWLCCCCTAVSMAVVAIYGFHLIGKPSFDCEAGYANAANGWSMAQKEYCCKFRGRACQYIPGYDPDSPWESIDDTPSWLDWWLWDFSLGIKFLISGSLALLCGCCCGWCCYIRLLKRQVAEHRAKTEHELMHELDKALQRLGAKSGEITITLMWDTYDDLDLHVRLPGHLGEISAENPKVAGGELDVDGNNCLAMSTTPIENIYWPTYDRFSNQHPPVGEYCVWVKVFDTHQHHSHPCRKEANITVVVTVKGCKEIFHLRLLPGCTQLRVCTFHYSGPDRHDDDQHHGHSHGQSPVTPRR